MKHGIEEETGIRPHRPHLDIVEDRGKLPDCFLAVAPHTDQLGNHRVIESGDGIAFLDPVPVIGYWLAFNVLNLALALYAFRLDRESPRPLWAMPLQQFVYRQLMYMVVIESLVSALLGTRIRWQQIERTGEVAVAGEKSA